MELSELEFIKGKNFDEAKKLVEPFFLVETNVNGEAKYISAEYNKKRILVETKNNIITKVVGNH